MSQYFIFDIFLALHMAALHNQVNVIDYLLKEEVEFVPDMLGLTPLDYAKRVNNSEIINRLQGKASGLNGNSD